jgi:hypothetical protein
MAGATAGAARIKANKFSYNLDKLDKEMPQDAAFLI